MEPQPEASMAWRRVDNTAPLLAASMVRPREDSTEWLLVASMVGRRQVNMAALAA